MKNQLTNKTVLITGVSSGIGREIAQLLALNGAHVFGTVRNKPSAQPIPGVELASMDVTKDSDINAAIQSVKKSAGPIHYLVNCAGYALTGAIEETSLDEARQQFETNFFGLFQVTKAVLPGMREQKFGRIVNISSAFGFLPAPSLGIYGATKHAVEGFTESLDHEVRPFGVRALLVEPAFTKTKFNVNSKPAAGELGAYAKLRERMNIVREWSVQNGDPASAVAQGVLEALTASSPKLRYPIGKAATLSRLRRFVPAGAFDKSLRKQFKLDQTLV
jgi:short-subunit dehydrogenase